MFLMRLLGPSARASCRRAHSLKGLCLEALETRDLLSGTGLDSLFAQPAITVEPCGGYNPNPVGYTPSLLHSTSR